MTNAEFERVYYPKYDTIIRAIARKLANKNDALMEDLYQEGLIALWKLEPRYAKDNVDAYIRQSVKFRMIDFVRKERPALYDSLTGHLERGDQVIKDEDTGEIRLLSVRDNHRRNLYENEEMIGQRVRDHLDVEEPDEID